MSFSSGRINMNNKKTKIFVILIIFYIFLLQVVSVTGVAATNRTAIMDSSETRSTTYDDIEVKTNTILNAECFASEEEATKYFLEMVLHNYCDFTLLAEDLSMLHTVEEYKKLCPAILNLEIVNVTQYQNGYALQFSNVKTYQIDAKEIYAVLTGDTSFLDEEERSAYEKLFSITKELKLDEMSEDLDKITAIHDYLVLNTVYDEKTAAGENENKASYEVQGILNNQTSVCSGYASAFRLLCMLQGIPCEYVWSEEGNHGWNLVEINGKWHHVDVTWDDPVPDKEGRVLHTYFMMTDEEVAALENHGNWKCECGGKTSHNAIDISRYRAYMEEAYSSSQEEAIGEVTGETKEEQTEEEIKEEQTEEETKEGEDKSTKNNIKKTILEKIKDIIKSVSDMFRENVILEKIKDMIKSIPIIVKIV